MKLFLHWLLWDLRRFRSMLLLWTLLLLGYTGFLAWLQSTILTVDPILLQCSLPLAVGLMLVAILMLLWLFTADPAAGTASFWKLQPPTGYAVAGSKLAIGFVFFVLMPPLLMGGAVAAASPSGMRWGSVVGIFETWVPLSLIGLASIASCAAAAGSPLQACLRMMPALILLGSVMLMIGRMASTAASWSNFKGGNHPAMPWIWFLAGTGLFMAARRSRHPARFLVPVGLFMPSLLFMSGIMLGWQANRTDLERSVPILEYPTEQTPMVGPPSFRNFKSPDEELGVIRFGETSMLTFTVPINGLPPNAMVSARWLELKLTNQEGRTVGMKREFPDISFRKAAFSPASKVIISPARFIHEELIPFSREACRAEGRLRVVLAAPVIETLHLRSGLDQISRLGLHRISFGRHSAETTILSLKLELENAWLPTQSLFLKAGETYSLWNHHSGKKIPLYTSEIYGRKPVTGAFLLPVEQSSTLRFSDGGSFGLIDPESKPDLDLGPLVEAWRLQISAFRLYATADLPVALDLLMPSRLESDNRIISSMIFGIPLKSSSPSAERRRLLRYALMLVNQAEEAVAPWEKQHFMGQLSKEQAERVTALEAVLEKVPSEGLPDLLWLVSEKLTSTSARIELSDSPLRRRIISLLTAEDLPALASQPVLFNYFQSELRARGLFPVPVPPGVLNPPSRN